MILMEIFSYVIDALLIFQGKAQRICFYGGYLGRFCDDGRN